jgi:uncharacterized phage protein gp47/JayE
VLTLDDLLTEQSEDEVVATFDAVLTALGIPVEAWPRRGIAITLKRLFARGISSLSKVQRLVAESGFLDTARGAGLTLLARCMYGVERIPASFATGPLVLTNTVANVYEYAAREAVFRGANGKAYTNMEPFELLGTATLTLDVVALEQGAIGTAPAGTVTELETTMLGVAASNPQAIVGVDDELDPALRQRCRDRIAAYGAGAPRGAYAFWARSAKRADGAPVNINRVTVSRASSIGEVTVIVAAPGGAPASIDVEAVADTLEEKVRPDTVTVRTLAAVERMVTPHIDVYAVRTPGLTSAMLESDVLLSLAALGSTWPIGGRPKSPGLTRWLFADSITGAVIRANAAVYECDIDTGDIALAPTDVVVLVPTITVRFEEAVS